MVEKYAWELKPQKLRLRRQKKREMGFIQNCFRKHLKEMEWLYEVLGLNREEISSLEFNKTEDYVLITHTVR